MKDCAFSLQNNKIIDILRKKFQENKKPIRQWCGLVKCGGDKGIRTPDLRIANATLYQLSHIPTSAFFAIFPCCVIIAHYSILTMIFSSFSYNYYFIINI